MSASPQQTTDKEKPRPLLEYGVIIRHHDVEGNQIQPYLSILTCMSSKPPEANARCKQFSAAIRQPLHGKNWPPDELAAWVAKVASDPAKAKADFLEKVCKAAEELTVPGAEFEDCQARYLGQEKSARFMKEELKEDKRLRSHWVQAGKD